MTSFMSPSHIQTENLETIPEPWHDPSFNPFTRLTIPLDIPFPSLTLNLNRPS